VQNPEVQASSVSEEKQLTNVITLPAVVDDFLGPALPNFLLLNNQTLSEMQPKEIHDA
jgi:hypothetical protein